MIKKGLRYKVGAIMLGLLSLVSFPLSAIVVVCYDGRSRFGIFYNDCLDLIFLRNTDDW